MSSARDLQTIIQDRQEWEAFGWGPSILAWGAVLTLRSLVELLVPMTPVSVGAAFAIAVVLQLLAAFLVPGLPTSARRWPLHGLWAVTALVAWSTGSLAPAVGLLTPGAGRVLELFFLGGALYQTGLIKRRWPLMAGGGLLIAASVAVAAWGLVPGLMTTTLVLAFGASGLAVLKEQNARS